MPSIKNIKVTIGGAESPSGTPAARTKVIPIRGVPTLDKKAEKTEDPVVLGNNMVAGQYLVADSVGGNIPLALRPTAGIGMLLASLLGTEETPVQIAACIRFMYTGSEASCKIIADAAADELESHVGDKGSESGDTNFGTAGVIDLTDVATDIVGELVTVIDAYTDYSCEKVFGGDGVDAGEMVAFTTPANTRQGKSKWVYVWFAGAATGIYRHEFTPNLSDTERSTYSMQIDGKQDNFLYDGCVVDVLNLSGALKAMVEADVEILGFKETIGESVSSEILEDVDPLIFHKGDLTLGEKSYTYLRNHSLAVANNHNPDGYGLTLTSRQYQQKGMFDVNGDLQVRLDVDSYAERAKIFAGTQVALSFFYKGGNFATDLPELMLIEIPYCELLDFEFAENAGVFDAKIMFRALNPAGILYNDPFTLTMLTIDSAAY